MKIKFNLKAGLSLTEEETKEYLKVAGDVATKLFSTKTEKKETGVKSVSFSDVKPYTKESKDLVGNAFKNAFAKYRKDLDLKKIAEDSVRKAIAEKHVFSSAHPGDEQFIKEQAKKIFHKKTGLGYSVAESEINSAYNRVGIFSYDDRSAEEIKKDARSYCLKKEHHLPKITEAEARYCSVWEIWRRHKNERWLNRRPDDKKVRILSPLVSMCAEYIPISTLEMWDCRDYRSDICQDYDFHKRSVVASMIVATSIKFAEAIVAAFRDVDRMSIENERISKVIENERINKLNK